MGILICKAYKTGIAGRILPNLIIFYADLDSFESDYTLTLDAVYHDYQFQTEYDFGSSKLSLQVENNLFNHIMGGNAALSLIKPPDAPAAYLLSLSRRR